MKIYISGRIKGLPIARAAYLFRTAKESLEARGYETVNPLDIPETQAPAACEDWNKCMVIDIEYLFDCEAIYMLANWRQSKGARIEHAIAEVLEKEIYYEATI